MNKMMLKKQYMMYAPKKSSSRLPSEYQEVEYISNSGTQWIDTGLILSNYNAFNINMDAKFLSYGKNYYNTLFGTQNTSDPYLGTYLRYDKYKYIEVDSLSSKLGYYINTKYNFDYTLTKSISRLYINNDLYGEDTTKTRDFCSYPLYLMGMNNGGSTHYSEIALYRCKITLDNVLSRDFIPCYRKSDNEIGLYDLVNNQFYTNDGSGTFLKGEDVIYTSTNAVSFATDSWSTIQEEAERISNFYEKYSFIPFNTPYAIYNPENNDTKNIRTITYNNEEIQIAIIGMCHDTLQTPYSGGGTKAGITWQTTKSLFKSAVDSSSSSGGWSSCSLRASLNSTHFNSLPQEMQNAIKVVAKKSNNGSGSIATSNDKLFTLSMVEIMGTTKRNSSTNLAIEGEGTQYEYYKNAPLIKDSNNITWTALSGTKGTCIANGNSYMTLIDGVQTPDANDYVNYRNAKEYKPSGSASYYGTRSFKTSNEVMYIWRAGNITYTTASNSDLEVCFAGCI